jgi:hypothetical protein
MKIYFIRMTSKQNSINGKTIKLTELLPRPDASVNSLGITPNPWMYFTLFRRTVELARTFE